MSKPLDMRKEHTMTTNITDDISAPQFVSIVNAWKKTVIARCQSKLLYSLKSIGIGTAKVENFLGDL